MTPEIYQQARRREGRGDRRSATKPRRRTPSRAVAPSWRQALEKTTTLVDGTPVPYLLYLYNDDPVKCRNWLLALNTADVPVGRELQRSFRMLCYLLPRDLKWFHQGGCLPNDEIGNWNAFEFWTRDQDPILCAAIELAADLGLKLQLGMPTSDDYRALAA